MGKLDDLLIKYEKNMTEKLGIKKVDDALLRSAAKACGPALYKADASMVSSSDAAELERVKKNFLIKKLGLEDSPKLDEAIQKVVDIFGSSNRQKYRAIFYYLLIKEVKLIAPAKVQQNAYLQELIDFYGGDYGTQKDLTETITFMRENGYDGVAKFLEYEASQASN